VAGLFPKWMNALPTVAAATALGGVTAVVVGGWYYLTPDFFEVGYMPEQPGGGFNHQIHVGQLGMDCRYCHTHVEESYHSNVPTVSTCMGCHSENKLAKLGPVEDNSVHRQKTNFIREAYASNESIEWRRIHYVPDYAHFPHAVHVHAGISCYSCHGSIPGMPVVYQAESLSMGWCLDCHREPEQHLGPQDKVTDLMWWEENWASKPVDQRSYTDPVTGEVFTPQKLLQQLTDAPPQHCAACHY